MKYKFLFILIFSFSTCQITYGQLQLTDTRDNAMGNASVASLPSYGFSKNVAFIPANNKSYFCLNIANHYLIKDLSPIFLSFIKSFDENFSITASAGRVGNKFFSEQFIETGLAKKLGDKFSAGIKIEFHQWLLSDAKYNNSSAFIPSFGLFACPIKTLSFGVIVRNPVRVRMNAIEDKKLPSQINAGIFIKVSEKISIATSVIQQNNLSISNQLGIEYKFHPLLFFRFGWHTVPVSETFGFGLIINKIYLDISIHTHPSLGNSSSIALTFPL